MPGQTLPVHICFAYFTMYAYFFRTSHRDKMSTLAVGRVCPGYVSCDLKIHHVLLLVNAAMPYVLVLLLLPLIVKARISYVYAHLKKQELPRETEMR